MGTRKRIDLIARDEQPPAIAAGRQASGPDPAPDCLRVTTDAVRGLLDVDQLMRRYTVVSRGAGRSSLGHASGLQHRQTML